MRNEAVMQTGMCGRSLTSSERRIRDLTRSSPVRQLEGKNDRGATTALFESVVLF